MTQILDDAHLAAPLGTGCRLGSHRVIEPKGALPQAAWKLDNTPRAYANEILCDVETLNVDSASFKQISDACAGDPLAIAAQILATVSERGKQHNAVTGSGGMFVGRVAGVGPALAARDDIAAGDRIASLVSLTLTPLRLDAIEAVDVVTGQVHVRGSAILFESGIYARLPDDLPTEVALAVLDVAGAPAQVRRLAKPGQTVCVIGADGKSGMLACAQARERVGPQGRVVGIVPFAGTPAAQSCCSRTVTSTTSPSPTRATRSRSSQRCRRRSRSSPTSSSTASTSAAPSSPRSCAARTTARCTSSRCRPRSRPPRWAPKASAKTST